MHKTNVGNLRSQDSIIKDIPKRFKEEKFKQYFGNIQNMLSLKSIENGFDGQIIRLWISHGYSEKDTSQLICISDSAGLTFGKMYAYIPQYSYKWDSTISREFKVTEIAPKSGWKSAMSKVQELGLISLPDYTQIPGYYLSAGAFGVMIEIATIDKYRIYEYPDYFEVKSTIKQANSIVEILRVFEREFDIKIM